MRLKVIVEMPLRRHVVAGVGPDAAYGDKAGDFFRAGFNVKNYRGYVSPKYVSAISDKLSRLVGWDINVFVIDANTNPALDLWDLDRLSDFTGVPLGDLGSSINFVMSGDNRQGEFSVWLYVHQLGEALEREYDPYGYSDGSEFTSRFKELEARLDDLVGARNKNRVFRMGSARAGKMVDFWQEVFTEFLWHGGEIRFNDVVDGVEDVVGDIKVLIGEVLDASVGEVLFNDYGE